MLTRQKEFLQWFFGGLSTAVVIAGGVYLTEHHEDVRTALLGPSDSVTLPSEKEKVLKSVANDAPEEKGGGSLSVQLAAGTVAVGESIAVRAQIQALSDLTDVKYEWLLPEGVTLVRGSQTGDLGSLSEGSQNELEIALNALGSENKQIHLQVYRLIDGERMGQVAQYNSVQLLDSESVLAMKRVNEERAPASDRPRFFQ